MLGVHFMFIFVKMFCVDVAKGVFSDEVILKSCSDLSRFSVGVDSILAAPGNVEVGMGGVEDADGSISINLVLSIASALKG